MLKDYLKSLIKISNDINEDALNKAIKVLNKAIDKKKNIFICGNGGSASLSDHALCDWTKRLYPKRKCKVFDLTSNKSLISAISNDISHNDIFSIQLDVYSENGDICIFISSSGNSKNVIKGIKFAKKRGLKIIGILGFSGGKAKNLVDIPIHCKTSTYEHHEDLAQILMHYIYLRLK